MPMTYMRYVTDVFSQINGVYACLIALKNFQGVCSQVDECILIVSDLTFQIIHPGTRLSCHLFTDIQRGDDKK
jgi:hypothetical protein